MLFGWNSNLLAWIKVKKIYILEFKSFQLYQQVWRLYLHPPSKVKAICATSDPYSATLWAGAGDQDFGNEGEENYQKAKMLLCIQCPISFTGSSMQRSRWAPCMCWMSFECTWAHQRMYFVSITDHATAYCGVAVMAGMFLNSLCFNLWQLMGL